MPTSIYSNLIAICELFDQVRPDSILDIGIGNGRTGFIARDILDIMHIPDQWKVQIDGIEIFPEYIRDHQRAIYNTIHIGNALDIIDTLGMYDMIYMGDVLEHFPKDDGWIMLDKIADHALRYVGLAVPIGKDWEQGEVYGNVHEEHKSVWEQDEFAPFVERKWLFNRPDAPDICSYALFKIDPALFRIHRTIAKAERLFESGHRAESIDLLVALSSNNPPDITTDFQLTDMLLRCGMRQEAIAVLERIIIKFPDEPAPVDMLAKLRQV